MNHEIKPSGRLSLKKITVPKRPSINSIKDAMRYGSSRTRLTRLGRWQHENRENFERSLHDQDLFDRGRLFAIGHLWLQKIRLDGLVEDFGLVSCRVVTDTGVAFIVDAFQNLTELENMKFHALGTGTTAEAASQTALVTELTTQYAVSSTRPTGTLGEKSGDAKTYETAATITTSATVAATEHAIMSQAATGGGVMLDRSVFSVVNLASGESLQATYDLTFPSGS
jgi:hypothetical protein